MVIATLAIIGTPLLFDAAAAADEFSFELSTNAPVTAQGYSNTDSFGGDSDFVTTDVIPSAGILSTTEVNASPDKKSNCPAPPPKNKPHTKPVPKPEPANKADTPNVSNVCTPVININMPQGAFYHPIPNANERQTAAISATTETIDPKSYVAAPSPTPDSFKFKIKNWVEAEITTQRTTLIIIFIGIFLLFSAMGFFTCKAVANQSKKAAGPIVAILLFVITFAFAAYWTIRNIAPQRIEDTVIERANAEEVTVRTDQFIRTDSILDDPEQAPTVQDAIAQSQSQLSSQLNQIARAIEPTKDNNTWWQLFALLVWGTAVIYVLLNWHTRHRSQAALTNKVVDSALPLDALYKLEETLANVVATGTRSAANTDQVIEFNEVLQAINSVRKQLESGSYSVDSDERPVTFHLRARTIEFRHLEKVLRQLEDELISRYELPRDLWRKNVLMRLAAARRAIISTCRVSPADSDLSIT